jgi:ADP-heptose:LPS heptosyltransferase
MDMLHTKGGIFLFIKSTHVLICRTDNIGDVVLTLPITAFLKKHYPDLKISFMCRAYAAPFVRMCSTIDTVVELESIADDPITYFKTCGADTVIFAQPNRPLAIAAFKAGIPNRIGNARQKLYQLIFCNQRVRFSKRVSALHEAQFNFHYLRPLGLTRTPDITEIIDLYEFKAANSELVGESLAPHTFNLILHPKSNGHGREWPISAFQFLAKELALNNPQVHCWITGSKEEGVWIESHAPDLLKMPNVSNICGQLSLEQLFIFIRQANGLIASGTGPLHISAAVGQRTLGLFPPTPPMHPGRWAPIGRSASFLCKPTACEGCERKATVSCECMENISPTEVASVVHQWINDHNKIDS